MFPLYFFYFFFFFNDTATTEIYTLSLHDALPISPRRRRRRRARAAPARARRGRARDRGTRGTRSRRRADRKSTRLNSSHGYISYAVFCLKKKKKIEPTTTEILYVTRYVQCEWRLS